jgi:RNA polymerase-binding transcription factor DksA
VSRQVAHRDPETRRGNIVDQSAAEEMNFLEINVSAVRMKAERELGTLKPGDQIKRRKCENVQCGKPISVRRLEAAPKAKYCIDCQKYLEQYGVLPYES